MSVEKLAYGDYFNSASVADWIEAKAAHTYAGEQHREALSTAENVAPATIKSLAETASLAADTLKERKKAAAEDWAADSDMDPVHQAMLINVFSHDDNPDRLLTEVAQEGLGLIDAVRNRLVEGEPYIYRVPRNERVTSLMRTGGDVMGTVQGDEISAMASARAGSYQIGFTFNGLVVKTNPNNLFPDTSILDLRSISPSELTYPVQTNRTYRGPYKTDGLQNYIQDETLIVGEEAIAKYADESEERRFDTRFAANLLGISAEEFPAVGIGTSQHCLQALSRITFDILSGSQPHDQIADYSVIDHGRARLRTERVRNHSLANLTPQQVIAMLKSIGRSTNDLKQYVVGSIENKSRHLTIQDIGNQIPADDNVTRFFNAINSVALLER